jgi:hypothetical protein
MDFQEDLLMANFRGLGAHWTSIAKFFDGRSESVVKNRWYADVRQNTEANATRPGAVFPHTRPGLNECNP